MAVERFELDFQLTGRAQKNLEQLQLIRQIQGGVSSPAAVDLIGDRSSRRLESIRQEHRQLVQQTTAAPITIKTRVDGGQFRADMAKLTKHDDYSATIHVKTLGVSEARQSLRELQKEFSTAADTALRNVIGKYDQIRKSGPSASNLGQGPQRAANESGISQQRAATQVAQIESSLTKTLQTFDLVFSKIAGLPSRLQESLRSNEAHIAAVQRVQRAPGVNPASYGPLPGGFPYIKNSRELDLAPKGAVPNALTQSQEYYVSAALGQQQYNYKVSQKSSAQHAAEYKVSRRQAGLEEDPYSSSPDIVRKAVAIAQEQIRREQLEQLSRGQGRVERIGEEVLYGPRKLTKKQLATASAVSDEQEAIKTTKRTAKQAVKETFQVPDTSLVQAAADLQTQIEAVAAPKKRAPRKSAVSSAVAVSGDDGDCGCIGGGAKPPNEGPPPARKGAGGSGPGDCCEELLAVAKAGFDSLNTHFAALLAAARNGSNAPGAGTTSGGTRSRKGRNPRTGKGAAQGRQIPTDFSMLSELEDSILNDPSIGTPEEAAFAYSNAVQGIIGGKLGEGNSGESALRKLYLRGGARGVIEDIKPQFNAADISAENLATEAALIAKKKQDSIDSLSRQDVLEERDAGRNLKAARELSGNLDLEHVVAYVTGGGKKGVLDLLRKQAGEQEVAEKLPKGAIAGHISAELLPKAIDLNNLRDPRTLATVGTAGFYGGLPGAAAAAIGAITPLKSQGAFLASALLQGIGGIFQAPVDAFKVLEEEFKGAGRSFEQSILSITAILQTMTDVIGAQGPLGSGQIATQLRFQESQARGIQNATVGRLRNIGISGATESTFVSGIVSALAQRGITATPDQIGIIAERLGGAIAAQRPQLLDNPGLLLRDIQDVLSGGPLANRTIVGQLVRPALTGFRNARTGADFERATRPLEEFPLAVTESTNPAAVFRQFEGAFDALKTQGGVTFIEELIGPLKELTETIKKPETVSAIESIAKLLGRMSGALISFQDTLAQAATSVDGSLKKVSSEIQKNSGINVGGIGAGDALLGLGGLAAVQSVAGLIPNKFARTAVRAAGVGALAGGASAFSGGTTEQATKTAIQSAISELALDIGLQGAALLVTKGFGGPAVAATSAAAVKTGGKALLGSIGSFFTGGSGGVLGKVGGVLGKIGIPAALIAGGAFLHGQEGGRESVETANLQNDALVAAQRLRSDVSAQGRVEGALKTLSLEDQFNQFLTGEKNSPENVLRTLNELERTDKEKNKGEFTNNLLEKEAYLNLQVRPDALRKKSEDLLASLDQGTPGGKLVALGEQERVQDQIIKYAEAAVGAQKEIIARLFDPKEIQKSKEDATKSFASASKDNLSARLAKEAIQAQIDVATIAIGDTDVGKLKAGIRSELEALKLGSIRRPGSKSPANFKEAVNLGGRENLASSVESNLKEKYGISVDEARKLSTLGDEQFLAEYVPSSGLTGNDAKLQRALRVLKNRGLDPNIVRQQAKGQGLSKLNAELRVKESAFSQSEETLNQAETEKNRTDLGALKSEDFEKLLAYERDVVKEKIKALDLVRQETALIESRLELQLRGYDQSTLAGSKSAVDVKTSYLTNAAESVQKSIFAGNNLLSEQIGIKSLADAALKNSGFGPHRQDEEIALEHSKQVSDEAGLRIKSLKEGQLDDFAKQRELIFKRADAATERALLPVKEVEGKSLGLSKVSDAGKSAAISAEYEEAALRESALRRRIAAEQRNLQNITTEGRAPGELDNTAEAKRQVIDRLVNDLRTQQPKTQEAAIALQEDNIFKPRRNAIQFAEASNSLIDAQEEEIKKRKELNAALISSREALINFNDTLRAKALEKEGGLAGQAKRIKDLGGTIPDFLDLSDDKLKELQLAIESGKGNELGREAGFSNLFGKQGSGLGVVQDFGFSPFGRQSDLDRDKAQGTVGEASKGLDRLAISADKAALAFDEFISKYAQSIGSANVTSRDESVQKSRNFRTSGFSPEQQQVITEAGYGGLPGAGDFFKSIGGLSIKGQGADYAGGPKGVSFKNGEVQVDLAALKENRIDQDDLQYAEAGAIDQKTNFSKGDLFKTAISSDLKNLSEEKKKAYTARAASEKTSIGEEIFRDLFAEVSQGGSGKYEGTSTDFTESRSAVESFINTPDVESKFRTGDFEGKKDVAKADASPAALVTAMNALKDKVASLEQTVSNIASKGIPVKVNPSAIGQSLNMAANMASDNSETTTTGAA